MPQGKPSWVVHLISLNLALPFLFSEVSQSGINF